MAQSGLASRREAKELIAKGLVTVNGKKVTEPGFGVRPDADTISLSGNVAAQKQSVLVYKPRGVETNKTTSKARDLHDAFPQYKHLAPIGRLDKDSYGLIIMSNDGVLARSLTSDHSSVGKTYLVTVHEFVTDDNLRRMAQGIKLDGVMTKPAVTTRVSRRSFTIVLHEGRKHQIRRMCDACKLTIDTLERIGIGHLSVATLKKKSSVILSPSDAALLKGEMSRIK
jgi:pseudouridine synthase